MCFLVFAVVLNVTLKRGGLQRREGFFRPHTSGDTSFLVSGQMGATCYNVMWLTIQRGYWTMRKRIQQSAVVRAMHQGTAQRIVRETERGSADKTMQRYSRGTSGAVQKTGQRTSCLALRSGFLSVRFLSFVFLFITSGLFLTIGSGPFL